ncbi:Aste57867_10976 [Aphanomyces stellatus]|uniref:Aste57867_10976 protein n=1 Tax=Aphanomyces stellatus TaxID=120398 RepID=A0A485KSX0_9STRA|nr:hypothetical protein As57867_010935 [Aphanomyces stellatus]VFT87844.1 Aste57867_10976 [Aphanomyces stellatus]
MVLQVDYDRVRFEYCSSGTFSDETEALGRALVADFPHLRGHIDGLSYALVGWRAKLWRFLITARVLMMVVGAAFVFYGEDALKMAGIPYDPAHVEIAKVNQWVAYLLFAFLSLAAQYVSTPGAFEVYYNDQLVFSKIESNRLPTGEELVKLCKAKGLKKQLAKK